MTKFLLMSVALAAVAVPASAQDREIEYPNGSLAYDALIAADYATAEKQLRADRGVLHNDPAKLINLGLVMAKTGRVKDARESFKMALAEEEVELVMADGRIMGSHDVALEGLAMIKSGRASARR